MQTKKNLHMHFDQSFYVSPYGHTVYMKFVNELSQEGFEKINFMFIDIAKKRGSRKLKILM